MMINNKHKRISWFVGLALLFLVYVWGISENPPGFFVDESAEAYNAAMIARTGASESGVMFPVFFQTFTDGFVQYVNPVQIYLLAIVFKIFPPSIFVARVFSALGVFIGCLLLGLLAKKVSGKLAIGVIVAFTALVTPWFFVVRGLLLEPQFIPLVLTIFLLCVYAASKKERWDWWNIAAIAASLGLLTYTYTSGRILSVLLGLGLLSFATSRRRFIDVCKVGVLYGITLIPIVVFNYRHPGLLTKRLTETSYIKPWIPWGEIFSEFIRRFLEDQSLISLLLKGDFHARHHVQGSGGPILFATFILAVAGLAIIIISRKGSAWWRFILYGLVISIVPGAITVEPFHQLRLIAYPVFLLLLMVPALELLLTDPRKNIATDERSVEQPRTDPGFGILGLSRGLRLGVLVLLLTFTTVQAVNFQTFFRREGPRREFDFEVHYKGAYDAAVAQPSRPIYLEDGFWGPAYIHALWYATVEGRPTEEFEHLAPGAKAPQGGVVISSHNQCGNCDVLIQSGVFSAYRVK